jgi:hypothetical protein
VVPDHPEAGVMELLAGSGPGFSPWLAALAQIGAASLQSWLARRRTAEVETTPEDELQATVFGRRLQEEIARAKRFGLELGLVVVTVRGPEPASGERLVALLDTLKHEVRDSDLVGRLGGARLAALLVQTGEAGAARVTARLRDRLMAAAGTEPASDVVVGSAVFPRVGPSAAALVAEAERGGTPLTE